ncbi:MAG: choice-of-anchor B family protein [Saprospiraceae bacterium]|nr:choice-of-anchor B family protein [Saprospiraceae bacterium]
MKLFYLLLLFFYQTVLGAQAVQLELLGHWRDPEIVGSAAYNNAFNEVWGVWVDGREYAVIGSTYGSHFIDVTEPQNPVEVYRVKGGSSGTHIIHRDFKTYQCYLYAVCDEGSSSTLQIMDLSYLPDSVHLVYNNNSLFTRSHNIFIDVPKARLYTSAETGNSGRFALGLYDISNPENPKFLNHYSQFGNIEAGHVHDCFVTNDTAYLNCGNDGFAVMDFSDYTAPKSLYTLTPTEYPHSGYNHSGWLTPDGTRYVMADETHGAPMKLIHFGDWSKIKISALMGIIRDDKEIPHNPLISCDYAYIAYYYDGLQIYRITDPQKVERLYHYPTSKIANRKSYEGAWGVYPFLPSGNILVADMQTGLYVIKGIETPCNISKTCQTISSSDPILNESDLLTIYPNPSNGIFNIQSKENIIAIKLYDLAGKEIYLSTSKPNHQVSHLVEIPDIQSGLYFVKITLENNRTILQKLLISQ